MIDLWVGVAVLLLIALTLIAWPLVIAKPHADTDEDELNVRLYQDKLDEIKAQLEQQLITPQQYAVLEADLKKQVLQDVQQKARSSRSRRQWLVLAITLIIVSVVALAMYFRYGDSTQLRVYYQQLSEAGLVKQELKQIHSVAQVIDMLKSRLQANPNSARGWYLLGRIYLSTGQYNQAVSPLSKSIQLEPNNQEYYTAYAQAYFFMHNKHLTKSIEKNLKSIVRQHPRNIAALNLLALNAYEGARYNDAVNYWQTMLQYFDVNSADGKTLLKMIATAQAKEAKATNQSAYVPSP